MTTVLKIRRRWVDDMDRTDDDDDDAKTRPSDEVHYNSWCQYKTSFRGIRAEIQRGLFPSDLSLICFSIWRLCCISAIGYCGMSKQESSDSSSLLHLWNSVSANSSNLSSIIRLSFVVFCAEEDNSTAASEQSSVKISHNTHLQC